MGRPYLWILGLAILALVAVAFFGNENLIEDESAEKAGMVYAAYSEEHVVPESAMYLRQDWLFTEPWRCYNPVSGDTRFSFVNDSADGKYALKVEIVNDTPYNGLRLTYPGGDNNVSLAMLLNSSKTGHIWDTEKVFNTLDGGFSGVENWLSVKLEPEKEYSATVWYKASVPSLIWFADYTWTYNDYEGVKSRQTRRYLVDILPPAKNWTKYESRHFSTPYYGYVQFAVGHGIDKKGWLITDSWTVKKV